MELHQTRRPLYSQGCGNQSELTADRMEKNICHYSSEKEFMYGICKGQQKLNNKKISYEKFTMTCWIEEGKAAGGKSRLLRIKYLSEFFRFYKTGVLMS